VWGTRKTAKVVSPQKKRVLAKAGELKKMVSACGGVAGREGKNQQKRGNSWKDAGDEKVDRS